MKKMNPYGKTREELLWEMVRTNPDFYGTIEDVRKDTKRKSKEDIIRHIRAFNESVGEMKDRKKTDILVGILVTGSIITGIIAVVKNLPK